MAGDSDTLTAELEATYDAAFGPEEPITVENAAEHIAEHIAEREPSKPDDSDGADDPDDADDSADPDDELTDELERIAEGDAEPSWFNDVFAPYGKSMGENGFSQRQVVERLLDAHNLIVQDPVRGIVDVAMQYMGDDVGMTDRIVTGILTASGRMGEGAMWDQRLATQRERMRPQVEHFASARPDFDRLRPAMRDIAMKALEAKESLTLEEIYQRAGGAGERKAPGRRQRRRNRGS